MTAFIARHGLFAIGLIVLLEEAGIPLLVPADLLILLAGARAAHSVAQLGFWLVLLTLLSSLGSSVFFLAVRRGGRPLVERFGVYVHLGPHELARSEDWLRTRGWLGIALLRAIPVVRHPAVVACAVLDIPYRRYLSAQIVGSAIYTGVFLLLGALVGPSVIDAIHLPRLVVRLIWLLLIAVGLPALLWFLCTRARTADVPSITRRAVFVPLVLASAAGTVALGASWAAGATIAALLGQDRPLNLTVALAHWLIGQGVRATTAYLVIYAGLLLINTVLGVVYSSALRPHVAPRASTLVRQASGLAILGVGLGVLTLVPALLVPRLSGVLAWWQAGGAGLALVLLLGSISYSVTTVCGHSLAVALFAQRLQGASEHLLRPPL